ncbi:N-acetyltransferase family protein [Mariniflexile litorale]|uniref:N-acetyltransferase family protein n=1 Tax=Mariniflexile litorale TaxID=3045158 RepID=A0AAU7EDV8_9FLAO|nr:N-acetyltransferase family protein [Mariniflexile sp. KMM 9835]MDQ8212182.1 GNAT family N-acetyltransferase [Mariniflexile sp. KMM 9835]
MIRPVKMKDAQQLVDIYNHYVLNTVVTFDDVPFTVDAFKEKIESIYKIYPFYVFEEDNKILGYAYANKWREKPAYKHTVESTVYLHHEAQGKQIGTILYTELLKQLKEQDYHVVVGGLTLPNEASVKLHEKFGFTQVSHFKEVGLKFDKWLDVGFWQLTF